MIRDFVQVADRGMVRLRTRVGELIAGRSFSEEPSVVEVQGWVKLLLRERGKIVPGSHREGHNVWTNVGREYLAQLMNPDYGDGNYRNDRMRYIGVGTGYQPTSVGVLSLVQPIAYTTGYFLSQVLTPTYPLTPSRTTVQYRRVFAENEITLTPGRIDISEAGLFTDGDPTQSYSPGSRSRTILAAPDQAPVAYKSFEPVSKTEYLELDLTWEIRF